MKKRDKMTKSDKTFIAILQAIAVLMFILAVIKLTSVTVGCTAAGENIIISPLVIDQPDTTEEDEPVDIEVEDESMIYDCDDLYEDLGDIIGC